MTEVFQIFLILIPAALVLFGMYISVNSLLNKQVEIKNIDLKSDSRKITIPLQLQAYERIILLLERISPSNLLLRLNGSSLNVGDFKQIIVREIREEFSHNLSQQIYMSDITWAKVKTAVESTIGLINETAAGLDLTANGMELSKNLLNNVLNSPTSPIEIAIEGVKADIRTNLL